MGLIRQAGAARGGSVTQVPKNVDICLRQIKPAGILTEGSATVYNALVPRTCHSRDEA
jgi:hypothetical protein